MKIYHSIEQVTIVKSLPSVGEGYYIVEGDRPRAYLFSDGVAQALNYAIFPLKDTTGADLGYTLAQMLWDGEVGEGSTRKWELMGEDHVEIKFSLYDTVKIRVGDFVFHEGEMFVCTSPYNPQYNQETGGYDYTVRFEAQHRLLKNRIFRYAPETLMSEASWSLTSTADTFLSAILTNFKALGIKYKRLVDGVIVCKDYTYHTEEVNAKALTFSNTKIIDALSMIAEAWDTEYWVENGVISVGKCERGEAEELRIGDNVENISGTDSAHTYATRLYAYGSTRNIPPRYNKDLLFTLDGKRNGLNGEVYVSDTSRKVDYTMFPESMWERAGSDTVTLPSHSTVLTMPLQPNQQMPLSDKGTTNYCEVYDDISSQITLDMVDYHVYAKALSVTANTLTWGASLSEEVARTIKVRVECQLLLTDDYKADRRDYVVAGTVGGYLTPTSVDATTRRALFGGVALTFGEMGNVRPMVGYKYAVVKIGAEVKVSINGDEYYLSACELSLRTSGGPITIGRQSSSVPTRININGESIDAVLNYAKTEKDNVTYYEFRLARWDEQWMGKTFTLPDIKENSVPVTYFTRRGNDHLANSVVDNRLMLSLTDEEGDGWVKTHGYIQDADVTDDEVVENTIKFDDIYPKATLRVTNVETYTKKEVDAQGMVTVHTYYLVQLSYYSEKYGTLTPFNFSKKYIIEGQQLGCHFESGSLGGMEFAMGFWPNGRLGDEVGKQVFEIIANTTYGAEMPNTTMAVKVGDTLVLTGWDTTESTLVGDCVASAEEELKRATIEYLKKSKVDPTTYTCSMMSDAVYAKGMERGEWTPTKGLMALGQRVRLYTQPYDDTCRESRVIGATIKLDIPFDTPTYTIGESVAYSLFGNLTATPSVEISQNASQQLGGNVDLTEVEKRIDGVKDDVEAEKARATQKEEELSGAVTSVEEKVDHMFTDVHEDAEEEIVANHTLRSVGNLIAEGYVFGKNGVAALGIASTSDKEGGTDLNVKTYEELDGVREEHRDEVATAYAVKRLKEDIGIAGLPVFSETEDYRRGQVVQYEGKGWKFTSTKWAGAWQGSAVERLTFNELAKPISIDENMISSLFR